LPFRRPAPHDALQVLDVGCLLDIERNRRVNVDATAPEQLYPDADILRPENNARFLGQCVERFREVDFADPATGRIQLSIVAGVPAWSGRDALELAIADPATPAGILAAAPAAPDRAVPAAGGPRHLGLRPDARRFDTLGAWGPIAS
jgi:hypothetical protein